MNNIKGLIIKDLLNLKSYMKTIVLFLIFILVMSAAQAAQNTVNYTTIIMITVMTGIISLSTFSYDEVAKSDKYLLSLPTDRKEIVKAKYVLTIGLTLLGGTFAALIPILITSIMSTIQTNYSEIVLTTLGGILGCSIITSIQIPSIYKWGAEKGRIQMFILIFIVSAVIGIIIYLASNLGIEVDIGNVIQILEKFAVAIMIISIIVMYYISYRVSCKIYSKKEI